MQLLLRLKAIAGKGCRLLGAELLEAKTLKELAYTGQVGHQLDSPCPSAPTAASNSGPDAVKFSPRQGDMSSRDGTGTGA